MFKNIEAITALIFFAFFPIITDATIEIKTKKIKATKVK